MDLPISRAEHLEAKIKSLENELSKTRESLDSMRKKCGHTWTPTQFYPGETREQREPDYFRTYYGKNWPSDRSILIPIPPKWIRKCTNCGKIEQTSTTRLVRSGSTGLHSEVPDFGGN